MTSLTIFVAVSTLLVVVALIVTIVMIRLDRIFSIALVFVEIAMYVAFSTFGQFGIIKAAYSDDSTSLSYQSGLETGASFIPAVIVIFMAGAFSFATMALWVLHRKMVALPNGSASDIARLENRLESLQQSHEVAIATISRLRAEAAKKIR